MGQLFNENCKRYGFKDVRKIWEILERVSCAYGSSMCFRSWVRDELIEYYDDLIYGPNSDFEIKKVKKHCDNLFLEYQSCATNRGTISASTL